MSVKGLIINPSLGRDMAVNIKFEPSMGIMARRVDKLGLDIRSFREPLTRAVQKVMIPSFQKNFEEHGRPPWIPLTDDTVKRKAKKGQPPDELIATGKLKRTMGYVNVWTIDSEKAYIQDLPDGIWYGKVHQMGLERESEGFDIGIPARPFVMAQREDINDIEEVFGDWLEERIIRAGLSGRGLGI
jgi:phage virion morphogenesis protein